MNIYIETDSPDAVREAAAGGFADGIVFTDSSAPTAAGIAERAEVLDALSREFAIPICVQVNAVRAPDLYSEARELARISDQIVVQLPFVEDAVEPMHRLSMEGVGTCASFVFNAAQAVLAAKAGASMVRVSLEELEAQGQTSTDAVSEIRALLSASDSECDVMVASPVNATQFTECVSAGAQIVCLRPDVLRSLLLHPLTDRALDRFLSGIARRSRPRDS